MNHGWNAVAGWAATTYYIDCTFDDPIPDRGEYASDQYFMLTGEELAQTHTWNEAFYEQLLDSLEKLNREENAAILMVTHDAYTASYSSRVLFIKDGRLFP